MLHLLRQVILDVESKKMQHCSKKNISYPENVQRFVSVYSLKRDLFPVLEGGGEKTGGVYLDMRGTKMIYHTTNGGAWAEKNRALFF